MIEKVVVVYVIGIKHGIANVVFQITLFNLGMNGDFVMCANFGTTKTPANITLFEKITKFCYGRRLTQNND